MIGIPALISARQQSGIAPLSPGQYVITSTSKTSAGVYAADGETLIRTLWSYVEKTPGTYTATWDGYDDNGVFVGGTDKLLDVLSHNVAYDWEARIGNTSTDQTGHGVIAQLRAWLSVAFYNGIGYFGNGFPESKPNIGRFSTSSPQSKTDIMSPVNGDFNLEVTKVAVDGPAGIVYYFGYDAWGSTLSFIFGTAISDDDEYIFDDGVVQPTALGYVYQSALSVIDDDDQAHPTGLAVGPTYLYAFRGGIDTINIINKTTGASVTSNTSFTNPREGVINGTKLWMIHGAGTVEKFSLSGTSITTDSITLSGLVEPLALGINSDGSIIIVVDGGSSQQIKAFNASGTLLWTRGQSGGYNTVSTVANDRWQFNHPAQYVPSPWVAFESDGTYWVGDTGSYRYIHFEADGDYITQVQSLPMNYQVSVEQSATEFPVRVFGMGYLEFADNGTSWTFTRNWIGGLTADYCKSNFDQRDMFFSCRTLDNGITYAFITYTDPGTEIRYPEMVRLVDGGTIEYSGDLWPEFNRITIEPNGDLLWAEIDTDTPTATGFFKKQTRTGYSGGWPTYGATSNYNTFPTIQTTNPGYKAGNFTKGETDSGYLVVWSWSKDNLTVHLGTVKIGGTTYIALTAYTSDSGVTEIYPLDGTFDLGGNVEYPGGNILVKNNDIFWNYIGEFWNNSQCNQWQHVTDKMLLVAPFGTNGLADGVLGVTAAPEMAGNAFSTAMVKIGSDYYIYHCDESWHSAVHRWKVSNLASKSLQTNSILVT